MTTKTKITLSKLKSMSGADIIAAAHDGGISVEIAGAHAFDIVAPQNSLDDKFLDLSRYLADQVRAEIRRKLETLTVEDMFNPSTPDAIIESIAETAKLPEEPVAPVAAEEKVAPVKKAAKKPASPKKAAKKKPKAADPAPASQTAEVAPLAESLSEEAPHETFSTNPFPDNTPDEVDPLLMDLEKDFDNVPDITPADVVSDVAIEDDIMPADASADADIDINADPFDDDEDEGPMIRSMISR